MDTVERATYRGQLTKLVKSAREYLDSPDSKIVVSDDNLMANCEIEEELNSYIHRITAVRDNLQRINEEFKPSIKAELAQKEWEAMLEYDDKATGILARLTQRSTNIKLLRQGSTHSARNESANQSVFHGAKLPKLSLRTFNGEFSAWLPFWEAFKTSVHDLTGTDKFNYLQNLLTGKAADSIAGFTPTNANYDAAIALLQEQYGNPEKLVDHAFHQLMTLPKVVSRTDMAGLRKLYNNVTTHTRSLTALGVPSSQYAIMMRTMLLQSFPPELALEFHRLSAENRNGSSSSQGISDGNTSNNGTNTSSPSDDSIAGIGNEQLRDVLHFLKLEGGALESTDLTVRKRTPTINTIKTATGLLTHAKESSNCCFCNSSEHSTENCNHEISLLEKKALLKSDGRCFKCTLRSHRANRCRNNLIRCKSCSGRHASSMCNPNFPKFAKTETPACTSAALYSFASSKVYLQTARVIVSSVAKGGGNCIARIILDGGSQRSYIKESIASKLQLKNYDTIKLQVMPFGSSKNPSPQMFRRVIVKLKGIHGDQCVNILAIIVPDICPDILQTPHLESKLLPDFILADDYRADHSEDGVGMLLGADVYWRVVKDEFHRIDSSLVAIKTIFGWTLQGPALSTMESASILSPVNLAISQEQDFDDLTKGVERLWELEAIPSSAADADHVDLIEKHISRNNFRYVGTLLWKEKNFPIHDNYDGALIRLRKLVTKLSKSPEKLQEYDGAISELILTGVARRVYDDDNKNKKLYYMPHQPVYRSDKETTKTRIVFDASASCNGELSLNDLLWSGPNLLPTILTTLLNFRIGKYAVTADVEKAFLQIELAVDEQNFHRFLWFEVVGDFNSIIILEMTRVTFGVTCSPFLLCATIVKHLQGEAHNFPKTSAILLRAFYMDDMVVSVDDYRDAVELHFDTIEIMRRASMNIRKWRTNDDNLRRHFKESSTENATQKVLGIIWHLKSDEISVDLEKVANQIFSINVTKRKLLQILASIYDPLGMLAPFVVNLKLIFQETWREKLAWDEPLPTLLMTQWNKSVTDFRLLQELTMPRYIFSSTDRITQELHIFADASPKAYGAVAFIRSKNEDCSISVSFLCSKNRVAPIRDEKAKQISLPKLELAAASIAAKLLDYVKNNVRVCFKTEFLWTDSRIALHWILNKKPNRDAYVRNRAQDIQKLTTPNNWRYCPGTDNPADLLTRGVSPRTLLDASHWFNGPVWLKEDANKWPTCEDRQEVSAECCLLTSSETQSDVGVGPCDIDCGLVMEDFSRFKRLLRVTAYVLRFIRAVRGDKPKSKWLDAEELEQAELVWIRVVQRKVYNDELVALSNKRACPKSSKILTLAPVLDENGVLRNGSRLQEADFGYDEAFPILLPKNSHFTDLLISHIHEKSLHAGTNTVLVQLRRRYWVIKSRQAVKSIIGSCTICKRLRGRAPSPPFAPLPKHRLQSSRPFETVGVDFAGPLYIREPSTAVAVRKVYVLLITCAVIRAVHLEVTMDLSAESCIMALRRFFARRNIPSRIISDNAKTASIEFRQLEVATQSEVFRNYLADNNVIWQFNVERAPWWGGFWERLVRSVKELLKVSIQRKTLSLDQLSTLLTEVEFIVNARPLTYIGDDKQDLSPLTPSHFLFGAYPTTLTIKSASDIGQQLRAKWQSRFRYANAFFKRFRNEYVQSLRSAHHNRTSKFSRALKVGDVVIVHDSSTPRLFWKLAIILKTFPGRDGQIRACEVKLHNGVILRRPVQHLFPLEIQS